MREEVIWMVIAVTAIICVTIAACFTSYYDVDKICREAEGKNITLTTCPNWGK